MSLKAYIDINHGFTIQKNTLSGGAFPPSYTPNYPSFDPTGSIPNLYGWYDSSQVSSIVKDGSNNVSKWKNLFLGATQGGSHFDDLVIPSGSSSPVYQTGQSYLASGGLHSGIYFDGVSAQMGLASGFANIGIQRFNYFFAVKTFSSDGTLADIADTQVSCANDLALAIRKNSLAGTRYRQDMEDQNPFNGGCTNGNRHLQLIQDANVFVYGVSFTTINVTATFPWVNTNGTVNYENAGYPSGAPTTTQSNAVYQNFGGFDPLNQFYLGLDVGNNDNGYGQGLIGEILIYGNSGYIPNAYCSGLTDPQIQSIMGYLWNKWK